MGHAAVCATPSPAHPCTIWALLCQFLTRDSEMGLGSGQSMTCAALLQEPCMMVSKRSSCCEQAYPFLAFPASPMGASSLDAARTVSTQTAQA